MKEVSAPVRGASMWSLSLFAQLLADERDDPMMRSEVIWGILGLTAALLVGAVVIYAVDNWRKRAATGTTDVDEASALSSYREMFENGEITEAEYAELRRKVAAKVKTAPTAASSAAAPGPGGMPARPLMSPAPPAAQSGERATQNPPPPPTAPTEPPPPPSTA